jgi:hypothetical protein
MQWSLIKTWAKDKGYTSFREKSNGLDNSYDYYWAKDNDPSVTGLSSSVTKLARDIYNHITDNKHIEYQQQHLNNKQDIKFSVSDYGS